MTKDAPRLADVALAGAVRAVAAPTVRSVRDTAARDLGVPPSRGWIRWVFLLTFRAGRRVRPERVLDEAGV
eukprot:SAG11_NODE_11865_length_734_cov_1.085039_3_plen_71_part_00